MSNNIEPVSRCLTVQRSNQLASSLILSTTGATPGTNLPTWFITTYGSITEVGIYKRKQESKKQEKKKKKNSTKKAIKKKRKQELDQENDQEKTFFFSW